MRNKPVISEDQRLRLETLYKLNGFSLKPGGYPVNGSADEEYTAGMVRGEYRAYCNALFLGKLFAPEWPESNVASRAGEQRGYDGAARAIADSGIVPMVKDEVMDAT